MMYFPLLNSAWCEHCRKTLLENAREQLEETSDGDIRRLIENLVSTEGAIDPSIHDLMRVLAVPTLLAELQRRLEVAEIEAAGGCT